jgi:hypothetical protein
MSNPVKKNEMPVLLCPSTIAEKKKIKKKL